MIGYFIAIIPLYIFVYLPISESYHGTTSKSSSQNALSNFSSSFIADDEPLSCATHDYTTHILSHEPLIIYIENFLSSAESTHLIDISEDKFLPSTVSSGTETSIQTKIRNSSVALIDRDDVVRCIEHRARAFQGWRPDLHIERLRTQRYYTGGHYTHHYDWSGASREADRVSTFMVYVDAQCVGGGTEFPRLRMPEIGKSRWCEFLECEEEDVTAVEGDRKNRPRMGITFKPLKGNAVYWTNLKNDGRGYEETWHAGLPVVEGTKVGLNIWSWGSARRREY